MAETRRWRSRRRIGIRRDTEDSGKGQCAIIRDLYLAIAWRSIRYTEKRHTLVRLGDGCHISAVNSWANMILAGDILAVEEPTVVDLVADLTCSIERN